MGQSKGGGYMQKETLMPEQMGGLQQILAMMGPMMQQAQQGYSQFLPGGGGGEAIKAQAMKDFQQQTIPAIMSAYGADAKGSSALNQALASGGANLNTDIMSKLAQMQLQAAQGMGQLGTGASQMGLGTQGFRYLQRQPPLWQQITMAAMAGGSEAGKGLLSNPALFM
jgi:hypothetical protein